MKRCALLGIFLLVPPILPDARGGESPPRTQGNSLDALVEAEWVDDASSSSSLQPEAAPPAWTPAILRAVERAGRLLRRIDGMSPPRRAVLEVRLADMAVRAAEGTLDVYLGARRLLREVAFANPLLDIPAILFLKRRDPGGVFHMCDQYYGFNARPGGGLYILRDPLGPAPVLVDVLERSVVENGRLRGQKLSGGSFLSPELSFDGRTILFAYSECGGKDLEWSPTASYHIFRVQADGTGLEQLTDGPWNDFDPCFLPGGRIAFISERRGGYLRCGRHCPVYTLHSMEADGSDIIRLSHHETHEWHPSVANDGKIVYTRWDYVDRDTNVAHHIWTCYPDGRDPRSFHGNYPVLRESRPWMEMSLRAIPGSPRFVGTAAAHHGHAFGSLVIIDPTRADDGAMSQIERLTPDVPFPEAEQHLLPIPQAMVYGTPWPLGEDDFLCVHDRRCKNRGIFWIDRHGNRELIYRDPAISCLSPIPLRPRPRPPVLPGLGSRASAAPGHAPRTPPAATVGVVNVLDSDFAWPEGTRISALRIIEVLPKSTAPPNVPRIGAAEQTNARAILGTVPVEGDGSAYFEVPPERLLYFQALDERGMAVQSMRSGTYLQPGETLVCRGCHEPKESAPPPAGSARLAFRRPPSPIRPEIDGSNPFSFVRLVQPALDRACVACHRDEGALDLSGVVEDPHGWTRSYTNLAARFGFYYNVTNGAIRDKAHGGSRTVAGAFGARAAPLLPYLGSAHHGTSLSPEDFHRFVLWLDANSEFFGSYESTSAQSSGEIVEPTLH